jgi:hypothetical protein
LNDLIETIVSAASAAIRNQTLEIVVKISDREAERTAVVGNNLPARRGRV